VLDYKGLDVLLESIVKLQGEKIEARLILAGAGNLDKYQHLLARIQHKVIDNRPIPDDEVYKYFQMSTIIALPYRDASQSGIAAIALPAAVPIVATSVGALPEVLQNGYNSLLVPPGDISALAGALRRLLSDPALRQRLLQGAQATVRQRLLWPDIAAQYHLHYQSLL
jgi:glycosyltransferase involved in cell wall biosynthesis